MNIKITMTLLFHLVYFVIFIDSFLETLYMGIFLFRGQYTQRQQTQTFYVILTALKFIFSALIGFIIDHVQYTYNLLFGSQILILLSYFFYLVFVVKSVQEQYSGDYLYFANGFLILGQQMAAIIILTLISKHYQRNDVPYQIANLQIYSYSGQIFCSLIFLVVGLILYNSIEKYSFQTLIEIYKDTIIILSIIPLIILLTLMIFLYKTFIYFKQEAEELMPEIKKIPIQQKGNLLQAIKNIFKTDSAWVALSAGIILGIINIWLEQYQQSYVQSLLSDLSNVKIYQIFGNYLIIELPTIISLSLVQVIVKNFEIESISLQALIDKAIDSFVLFLLSILFATCFDEKESGSGGKSIIFLIIEIFQQYCLTISGASIIGIQKQNYRNQGLTFGMLWMIQNGFAVWVVLAICFGQEAQNGIIYGFAFGYSLISIISSKMLQFDKQVNKLGHRVANVEVQIKNDEPQDEPQEVAQS
ncbi:unnamed protein product (macronuclear) [Paramecium tetraurelia]|uniref:Transmembrane protein n=1 Tax=Paramecium tetraurelia TaxID=5888 RepID=A0CB66_PARTE|nr:uncharacterized protein GSPATT00036816001 [Paramecium tetraurelia]CAK68033.1 unnamed protein product [Paramecium tetraurelia]|eukprot:XP_001435430.1 hypothetical protein (macronuclear) [Paramecium tetraurelia strain d4-2]